MQTLQNESGAEGAEFEKFCTDVGDGLHAMGQPLTILRSAIAMLTLPQVSEERRRYCMEAATSQIERMCSLFSDVSQLVAVRQSEAEISSFRLWNLLAPLVEAQNSLLRDSGIEVRLLDAEPDATVIGDAERTEQALSAILSAATSLGSDGDAIEVEASVEGGFAGLVLRNARRSCRRIQSGDRLRLALAEACIRSQGGEYALAEDPFCVSVSLPLRRSEAEAGIHAAGPRDIQLFQSVSPGADATST